MNRSHLELAGALLLAACSRPVTGAFDAPPTARGPWADNDASDGDTEAAPSAERRNDDVPVHAAAVDAAAPQSLTGIPSEPFKIVFRSPARWSSTCVALQKCVAGAALPLCTTTGTAWSSSIRLHAPVTLQGRLVVRPRGGHTLADCIDNGGTATCCNHTWSEMVLETGGALISIGRNCNGDDSGECCPLPADGRQVVVDGSLEESLGPPNRRLQVAKAKMCHVE